MWIRILSSDISARCSLAVAPSGGDTGASRGAGSPASSQSQHLAKAPSALLPGWGAQSAQHCPAGPLKQEVQVELGRMTQP